MESKVLRALNVFNLVANFAARDAVGGVIWLAKIGPEMTYEVSSGTLSLYSLCKSARRSRFRPKRLELTMHQHRLGIVGRIAY